MTDRHEKWVRVEPGHVIPAGQPMRWEYENGSAYECAETYCDRRITADMATHFVDSSWRPPLNLPTEPTWGIAVYTNKRDGGYRAYWAQKLHVEGAQLHGENGSNWSVDSVLDFIPLTDEQVARIEAAR